MIREKSLTRAGQIIDQVLESNNTAVIAGVSDTPVAVASEKLAAPCYFNSNEMVMDTNTMINLMLQGNVNGVDGLDEYDVQMRQITNLATASIKRTIYLTKNVALPVIESIVEKITPELNEVSGGNGLAFNIIPDTSFTILKDPILQEAVGKYKSMTTSYLSGTKTVPHHQPRDAESVQALLAIGQSTFDKALREWATPYIGDGTMMKVYADVFVNGQVGEDISKVIPKTIDGIPKAIIAFIIATNLSQELDDGIEIAFEDYEDKMISLMAWCGHVINFGLSAFASQNSMKRVVSSYPKRGDEFSYGSVERGIIRVNPDHYNAYLERGGSPEALMGACLTDRDTVLDKLLENADEHVKVYNRTVVSARNNNKLQVVNTMRSKLMKHVSDEIVACNQVDPDGSVDSVWKGVSINAEVAQEVLSKQVSKLTINNVTDIYGAVRQVVLGVFFADTDVQGLLEHVDATLDSDSENTLDVQDAVNIAVFDYIVNWVCHQLVVGYHSGL